MSESTTTTSVATPEAPKTVKKAAKKTTNKVSASKASKNGDNSGLRKPQIAILTALNKSKSPLSRKEIAEKAKTDLAFLSTWIGSHDPAVRKANEAKRGVKGLLTLGAVKSEQHDVDGRDTIMYVITATGRKLLEKAQS